METLNRKTFLQRAAASLAGVALVLSGKQAAASRGAVEARWTDEGLVIASRETGQTMTLRPDGIQMLSDHGVPIFRVDSSGKMAATQKMFNIEHPVRDGWRLQYGCLEGPENAVYHRGTVTGASRVRTTTVSLPEWWPALVGDQYTVHLTPHARVWMNIGQKGAQHFTVSPYSEFGPLGGHAPHPPQDFAFDYLVIGERQNSPLLVEHRGNVLMMK